MLSHFYGFVVEDSLSPLGLNNSHASDAAITFSGNPYPYEQKQMEKAFSQDCLKSTLWKVISIAEEEREVDEVQM